MLWTLNNKIIRSGNYITKTLYLIISITNSNCFVKKNENLYFRLMLHVHIVQQLFFFFVQLLRKVFVGSLSAAIPFPLVQPDALPKSQPV